ncbi:MAG: glycosyltransferase family 2 protein [Candidatus Eremiobacteraeota bacterium]|nr:glycosyltransferase family 2 protein [Candidatus Eremiobacteraeota bacterium]
MSARALRRAAGVQFVYASNALGALAVGFAAGAAAMSTSSRLRAFNGAAALACTAAAAGMRALAHDTAPPRARDPELRTEPSLPTVDYSIVVPVYNRPHHVSNLLARLCEQAPSWRPLGSGEIVVVDDGSVDDTRAVAERLAAAMPLPTRVVSMPHAGPGAARNAGFAAARGGIGVSIDSDCLPDEDWLPGLLDEVRANPDTIAFARIRSEEKLAYPIENAPDRKGFVSASFALERAAFCKLGGFYRGYGMSHEDLDFVEVARAAGYRVVRAHSYVHHPLRAENAASIWRVGLNSKYANLFALRHGARALGMTRTTPYYFFGVAGNYGSSIALLVIVANVLAAAALARASEEFATHELRDACLRFGALGALYVVALCALGLRVGAGFKRLPHYVTTLASFQLATLLGRVNGSLEYGFVLL